MAEELDISKPITELASKYGDDYINILTKLLIKAGKVNSGKLIDSIQTDLRETANELSIEISAENYFKYIDSGRKPGTYPNLGSIKQWVSMKGLPPESTFPIAHSIYKFGIKPTNIFDKGIKQIEELTTDNLEDELTDEIVQKIIDKYEQNTTK